MPVSAQEAAQILEDTGTLLELKGENTFKVRAFQNGARALKSVTDDLGELIKANRLIEIKGIGRGLADAIAEIYASGRLHEHDRLQAEVPTGLLDLIALPGIGPKKAKYLHDELEIHSVGELEYACRENRLAKLKGFGQKSQESILAAILFAKRNSEFFLYPEARREAEAMLAQLIQLTGVTRVQMTGELRRCCETISEIVFVVESEHEKSVLQTLLQWPGLASGARVVEDTLHARLAAGMRLRIEVAQPQAFAAQALLTTGCEAFLKAFRTHIAKKGMTLNEGGLARSGEPVPCVSEEELFKKAGVVFVPPELREAEALDGLLRARGVLKLIERRDVRGLFHVHTKWSDGAASVAEMAATAQKQGFSYLGISDHSQSAFYAQGLKPAAIRKQEAEIADYNKGLKAFRIFRGIESDILADGSLDYDATLLNEFDFIIASVHSRFKMNEAEMTARIVSALKNPHTTMLGHMTGRLLLSREAYALDVKQVIDTAAEYGKIIELNAHPHRLDMDWRWLRYATSQGVKISINPDAHDIKGIADVEYGVAMARKGGLRAADVINTLSLTEISEWLHV